MDETRQLSLEVIVTLAENAPAMVRKFDNFLKDFGMCNAICKSYAICKSLIV